MHFMMNEFINIFFANFGVRDQFNFDNGQKWSFEMHRIGLQILVESKLLVLAPSNKSWNNAQDFYFMIHEFTSKFFSKFGIRDPLNFDDGSKLYSETRQTGLQILIESKLFVLAPSNTALNSAQDFYLMIHEFSSNFLFKFRIGDPLNFDDLSKWYSETHQTGVQILLEF